MIILSVWEGCGKKDGETSAGKLENAEQRGNLAGEFPKYEGSECYDFYF